MNYGCGETTETAASSQYSDDYWSNPPSDINSEEYRVWYESYCSYFYPQTTVETGNASSSADVGNSMDSDALLGNVNGSSCTVNSATVTTTTTASADSKEPSDAANDAAGGKKRKKNKKDSAVNPKPSEPPGEQEYVVDKLSSLVLDFTCCT